MEDEYAFSPWDEVLGAASARLYKRRNIWMKQLCFVTCCYTLYPGLDNCMINNAAHPSMPAGMWYDSKMDRTETITQDKLWECRLEIENLMLCCTACRCEQHVKMQPFCHMVPRQLTKQPVSRSARSIWEVWPRTERVGVRWIMSRKMRRGCPRYHNADVRALIFMVGVLREVGSASSRCRVELLRWSATSCTQVSCRVHSSYRCICRPGELSIHRLPPSKMGDVVYTV